MVKTGLMKRENGAIFRKKSRRDGMMRSKSFDTQEVRGIVLKEAEEFKGVPISWMEIIEDAFQMERKNCKNHERVKICWRKSMPERGRCFSMDWAPLSSPMAVDEKRFVAAERNSMKE